MKLSSHLKVIHISISSKVLLLHDIIPVSPDAFSTFVSWVPLCSGVLVLSWVSEIEHSAETHRIQKLTELSVHQENKCESNSNVNKCHITTLYHTLWDKQYIPVYCDCILDCFWAFTPISDTPQSCLYEYELKACTEHFVSTACFGFYIKNRVIFDTWKG